MGNQALPYKGAGSSSSGPSFRTLFTRVLTGTCHFVRWIWTQQLLQAVEIFVARAGDSRNVLHQRIEPYSAFGIDLAAEGLVTRARTPMTTTRALRN